MISFLDMAVLLPDNGSMLALGDRAAVFSEPAIDSGRDLVAADPRDEGRCCHDIVLDRAGAIAALGELCGAIDGFRCDCVFSGSGLASC